MFDSKLKHIIFIALLFFFSLLFLSYVLVYYNFNESLKYAARATLILVPVYFYKRKG